MSLVLALVLGLFAGAGNSLAAHLTWTDGGGYWQSTTAWTTGLTGGTGGLPGMIDAAFFTNATAYQVRLSNDVTITTISLSNASNTTATVTLDLGTNTFTTSETFLVGSGATSTTIVYLGSSTNSGKGLVVPGHILLGKDGIGTLFATNGNVVAGKVILGTHGGSRGTLVLSGSNTIWNNTSQFTIGSDPGSLGSSLVISNSASMNVVSSFRLGSGSSRGGSGNNTLLLDTGGKLFTHSGPVIIGHWSGGFAPSHNNTAIVQGGAVWDNGRKALIIGSADGGAATGNVVTVGIRSAVTNIANLAITAGNTLDLAGGLIQATTTSSGIVGGFGTVAGNMTIASGGLLHPANSLGQLTFSNNLTLVGNATTTVQLGAHSHSTVVNGNLTLNGTLNVADGGGFTNGTYTLFRYGGTLITNGSPTILTIGQVPDADLIYTVDISSNGYVRLTVQGRSEHGLKPGEPMAKR